MDVIGTQKHLVGPFIDVKYHCGCERNIDKYIPFHPAEDKTRAGSLRVHNPDVQCICSNPYIGSLMNVENPAFPAQLIIIGASVNYTDSDGCTPLHRCLNVEMAAWLIENGANINFPNHNGDTPLHIARTFEMTAWLIDHGADINSRNYKGDTPLHKLMLHCKEYTDPMKFLIEKGANVDAVNHQGQTPLHHAVQCRLKEAVATLLYYNADTSVRDNYGFTPIMYAITCDGDASERLIYEMLLGYEDNFSCSANGDPTLLTLALVCKSPHFDEMIDLGVDFSNLRRELRILLWCIHQRDIEEFKWFWDIFDYKESWYYCNSILDVLLTKDKYSLFDHVLESPKMEEVIEVQHRNEHGRPYLTDFYVNGFSSFTMTLREITCFEAPDINISKVLDVTMYRGYNKSKAEQAIFVLLSYGYVASEDDAHRIFKLYGYGPLFELLLHSDIQKHEHLHRYMINMPPPLLAKVLLNPGIDARKYIVSRKDEDKEAEEAEKAEETAKVEGAYVSDREVIFMGVGVPSLLELSRNQARVAIWNGYKIQNIKQFTTTVNRMVIPPLIKDIINLKLPIYYPDES